MYMKKNWRRLWMLLFLLTGILAWNHGASAEEKNIALGTQGLEAFTLNYGDTGTFTIDTEAETSAFFAIRDQISQIEYGTSYGEEYLEVSSEGAFRTLGIGSGTIAVAVYNAMGEQLLSSTYSFTVTLDMTNTSLEKSSFTAVSTAYDYDTLEFQTKINGLEGVGTDTPGLEWDYVFSNDSLAISVNFTDGTLTFNVSGTGSTKAEIEINEKTFTVAFNIRQLKLSSSASLYMKPKASKKLKVINAGSSKVTWKSTNSNVVSVSSSGKIKAKKIGNAVITAKVDGKVVGCAVSVITGTRLKVVKKARYIFTHQKYSQPLRMSSKYYDCSSLVWKCYKLEKKYFGDRSYAPTAAAEAQYCAQHKKMVSGNIEKNIQKMKYRPGALTFKTGANNGRYKGIYHVEMFIGYIFEGVDSNGKPIVGTRWGARYNNYEYGSLWAQP